MYPTNEPASLGNGMVGGNFTDVVKTPKAKAKQYNLPHMTVNETGACSIVNSFFQTQGISPNNVINMQFDQNLGLLRFRIDRFVDYTKQHVPLTAGNFRIPKKMALFVVHNARNAMSMHSARKMVFVICRQDAQGWFYAKAARPDHTTPPPVWFNQLSHDNFVLWNLPHNVK